MVKEKKTSRGGARKRIGAASERRAAHGTPGVSSSCRRAGGAMAAAAERVDELVREYLLFRGFTATLKQLDAEIKADKEKGFRVRIAGRKGLGWFEEI